MGQRAKTGNAVGHDLGLAPPALIVWLFSSSLIHSLESISLQQTTEPDLPEALSKPATKAELPSPPSKGSRFALDLPPPDSDEWQAMDLPPSRSPRQDPTRRKAKGY